LKANWEKNVERFGLCCLTVLSLYRLESVRKIMQPLRHTAGKAA